jgi:hypothetical protein
MDMQFVVTQLVALVVSLVACWCFWYWILQLKPKVNISPVLVYNKSENLLEVKIINMGRQQVTDIDAEASLVRHDPHKPGFRTTRIYDLPLDRTAYKSSRPQPGFKK